MFESSSKSRKIWNARKIIWHNAFQLCEATDEHDLEVIMVVYVEERILKKTKKSGVRAPVHILGCSDIFVDGNY